jgi:hypothetical protein
VPNGASGVGARSATPARSYTAIEVFTAVTMAASPMAPDGSAGQFGPILGIASKCKDETGAFAAASPDVRIDTDTRTAMATQTPARPDDLLIVQSSQAWGRWAWSVNVSETVPGYHEPPRSR